MTDQENEDPLLAEARDDLRRAIESGKTEFIVMAIEELLDVKVALAVEELADRVQDASGVRP